MSIRVNVGFMMTTASAIATEDARSESAFLRLPAMATPASGRRWKLRAFDRALATAIEGELACDPALAQLLAGRGVTAGGAARHIRPSLRESLPDPSVLEDMDKAADRIVEAILKGERCGVFGDYDVDGTCAAAILKRYFAAIGAPLDVYLPDRVLEGYGPTIEAFRALKVGGAAVVMTVDCGAAAHEAIDAAAREGLTVIVLDHHQMEGSPPAGAYAAVNPHRSDDRSGLTMLSAAGIAFMAIVAVNRALKNAGYFGDRRPPDLMQFLDLAALGIVCDVMPMTGLARILTAQGLKVFASGGNPGLRELGQRAGVSAAPTAYDLGFLLGPRINAAGRIGHARLAFELLTTADPVRRSLLVERLHIMNAERRQIEKDVQEQAIAQIERDRLDRNSVIVAAGEGWHQGVIGIVAGRLKDRFDRPAIVIAVDGGIAKGSARSIGGVDIGAAIRAAKNSGLLSAGGGHAMAAGLTIDAASIAKFASYINERCQQDVDRARASKVREIDAIVSASAVSGAFTEAISAAGPFGSGNPEPLFVLTSIRAERIKIVGDGHLACTLLSAVGESVRAIAFRAADAPVGALLASGRRLHVAGRIKADKWRGAGAGQFEIVDVAEALD